MRFPELDNWEPTRDALHHAAQVLGAIKVAAVAPQPNELHYSLEVIPGGAGTGPLTRLGGGELQLGFTRAEVRLEENGAELLSLPLAGTSQMRLADELLVQLQATGRSVEPDRARIVHRSPFQVALPHAAGWAQVVARVYGALDAMRDQAGGTRTPVVLWPHHFDMAFRRFLGDGADVHQDPHLAFGFAPASEGLSMPYLYWYAWPLPDALVEREAPGRTRWQTQGWTGLVLEWSELSATEDPAALLQETLQAIWDFVTPTLDL